MCDISSMRVGLVDMLGSGAVAYSHGNLKPERLLQLNGVFYSCSLHSSGLPKTTSCGRGLFVYNMSLAKYARSKRMSKLMYVSIFCVTTACIISFAIGLRNQVAVISVQASVRKLRDIFFTEIEASARAGTFPVAEKYNLTNNTNSDVTLRYLGAECGCVQATCGGADLAIGDTVTVPARGAVDIGVCFRPAMTESNYKYTVRLASTDGSIVAMTFSGDVRNDLSVVPDILKYNCKKAVDSSVYVDMNATVLTADPDSAYSIEVDDLPDCITVNSITKGNDVRIADLRSIVYCIRFALKGISQGQRVTGNMALVSRSPTQTSVRRIPYDIWVKDDVCTISELTFGLVEASRIYNRRILVESTTDSTFEILKISTPGGISADWQKGPGRSRWVDVTYSPNEQLPLNADLVVVTDKISITVHLSSTIAVHADR